MMIHGPCSVEEVTVFIGMQLNCSANINYVLNVCRHAAQDKLNKIPTCAPCYLSSAALFACLSGLCAFPSDICPRRLEQLFFALPGTIS